jgi:isoquinoline 1-oxidoreductase beta subunit
MSVTRREFLKVGAAVGGGLLVEVWLPRTARADVARGGDPFAPSAFLRIAPDGVTFVCPQVEMGQGILTGLAMLVAEELEIAPEAMRVVAAPADRAYDNPGTHLQLTGGSASVKDQYEPLRLAGATAREMLRGAASRRWGVPVAECIASAGAVTHAGTGKQATYEELAEDATRSEVPRRPPLKSGNFKVIGKPVRRVDARPKIDGSGVFGIDVRLPDMLLAAVVRCPVPGGAVKGFDAAPVKAMPGVVDVVRVPSGIAILARDTWSAREAAGKLLVTWDEGPNAALDSGAMLAAYRAAAAGEGKGIRSDGDAAKALAGAARKVEASYHAPFLAHATMEPQNATAHVTASRCEVWAPTQGPGVAKEIARQITGLGSDEIVIHTTLVGGGFGRRLAQDYVAEAIWCAKAAGKPVKVVWSREDDFHHDVYRPAALHVMQAGLAADGSPVAWTHRIVTQSIMKQAAGDIVGAVLPFWVPTPVKRTVGSMASWFMSRADDSAVEGADKVPYTVPNVSVRFIAQDPGVPVGFWRAVGHSQTSFAVESFVDELARAAGKDPYLYRQGLLGAAPRNRAVLDLVAAKAGWGGPLPPGRFRGIAQHDSFGSFAAAVAEVEVSGGAIAVKRVVIALDCGLVVNPNLVAAQLEGSVVFGLSAALKQEITWRSGRVEQSNFNDFDLLRVDECPVIETHLVSGNGPPTGVGEPGLPPVAPAVANAVFAATGQRLRSLPLRLKATGKP